MSCPVNVEEKGSASRADDATQGTSYLKRAFHNNDGKRVYTCISTRNWKQGLYNHRHSFSNSRLRNQAALSRYFWNLKDQRRTPQIK